MQAGTPRRYKSRTDRITMPFLGQRTSRAVYRRFKKFGSPDVLVTATKVGNEGVSGRSWAWFELKGLRLAEEPGSPVTTPRKTLAQSLAQTLAT